MLYILFTTLLLLPFFLGIGHLVEKICTLDFKEFSLKILLGILTLNLIFVSASFFFPLNIYIEVSVIIIGLSAFFYLKSYLLIFEFLKKNCVIFLIFTVIILISGSYFPFILDHFGYYVPTIKWLREIGLAKGISNLDLLLGQMSFWHFLVSGFSNFSDIFLRLNAVLLVIYLIYILEKKAFFHLLFFPVLLIFVQSPSPDLPATVFSLIVLNEILAKNRQSTLLFALAIYAFAIKPPLIWAPILVLLYHSFILKSSLKYLVVGFIVLALFVLKNCYSFGYPIFPLSILDLHFPWKTSADLLKTSAEVSIEKTFDMQYSFTEIQKFSIIDDIKNWLFLPGIKSWINCGLLISMLLFLSYTIRKKDKLITFLFISIGFKTLLILYISAQYRFFLDVFFVIFLIFFSSIFKKKLAVFVGTFLSVVSIVFLSAPILVQKLVPSFNLGHYMLGFHKDQWLKPAHFDEISFKTYQIGNLKFNVVENYPFSFSTPLPAITPEFLKQDLKAGIFPQLISNDLKDGFIAKKLTADERQKLKLILEDLGY